MEQFDQKGYNQLQEQSVRIKFQNLEISVQEKNKNLKTIVNSTNGVFIPGELSILMGPTGAGKTTLLNVLSRNTYKLQIKGDIIYTKKYKEAQLSNQEISKCLQIVHQEDAFYEYMTPYEVLDFAIKLKNYQSSAYQILKKIQLQACAHNYIGGLTTKGISGGERKRLSIALALLSNPQILILDEPTTGLDSQTAEIIIKLIKKQAQKYNRTVIATLHQPSSELFKFFNSIMLLSQGYTIYFGPAGNVIQYFQSNGFQCEKDYNPSEFFLEILSQINSIQISQFAQYNENY